MLQLAPSSWYEGEEISIRTGDPVVRIDRAKRAVHTASGHEVGYDHLVLCTGASALELKAGMSELVSVLRTDQDAMELRSRALAATARGDATIVVGGGLLGLELAVEFTGTRRQRRRDRRCGVPAVAAARTKCGCRAPGIARQTGPSASFRLPSGDGGTSG